MSATIKKYLCDACTEAARTHGRVMDAQSLAKGAIERCEAEEGMIVRLATQLVTLAQQGVV